MDLSRENLSQLVLDNIQQSIRNGEFKPGDYLPSEKVMSEKYHVGKSSIREAIKMLHVLGVVESVQGRGTYIRESIGQQVLRPLMFDMMLQRSHAEELYEFRLMFDTAYMRIAIAKATVEEKAEARAKFYEYRELCKLHSPKADEVDHAFHSVMLNATRNQFIIKIGVMLMELCHPYTRKGNAVLDDTVMDNHEKLMEMFCSGNGEGLEDVVVNCLIVFRHFLNTEYEKQGQ